MEAREKPGGVDSGIGKPDHAVVWGNRSRRSQEASTMSQGKTAEGWMKVSDAAEALGVSPATVRRRVSKGEIEGRKGESGVWEVRLEQRSVEGNSVEVGAGVEGVELGGGGRDYREEMERYQKLAGASVMLAQRRADAAEEAVVRSRAVVHQLRKVAWVTGGTAAAVLVLSCLLIIGLGVWGSSASAEAEANRQALVSAEADARQSRAEASAATREAARLLGRLEALEERVSGLTGRDEPGDAMVSVRTMPGVQ